MQVCEVCRLLDGDTRLKPCQFCTSCQVWICGADIPNMARRARAMLMKRLGW